MADLLWNALLRDGRRIGGRRPPGQAERPLRPQAARTADALSERID
ncbi:MAG: hypothetical protein ACAI18_00710 [Gemmatimonadales bacterium]